MDPLQVLIAVFAGIVAISLLLQSLAFWGIHRSVQNISGRLEKLSADLLKHAESLSGRTSELLTTVKAFTERFQGLQENLTATSETVQRRVVSLDAFLEEATGSARHQVARIQQAVDGASRRVEQSFDAMLRHVLAPINEVSAVVTGIRVGLDVLTGRRKRPVNPSRQDEEMFI